MKNRLSKNNSHVLKVYIECSKDKADLATRALSHASSCDDGDIEYSNGEVWTEFSFSGDREMHDFLDLAKTSLKSFKKMHSGADDLNLKSKIKS
jgi:hypothetical protein